MKPTFILPLLAALAFQGCSTSTDKQCASRTIGTAAPISLDELESLSNKEPLRGKSLRVTFENIIANGGTHAVPIDIKPGRRALVEPTFEVRYPTEFELPKTNAKAGGMTPTTPMTFETK